MPLLTALSGEEAAAAAALQREGNTSLVVYLSSDTWTHAGQGVLLQRVALMHSC